MPPMKIDPNPRMPCQYPMPKETLPISWSSGLARAESSFRRPPTLWAHVDETTVVQRSEARHI